MAIYFGLSRLMSVHEGVIVRLGETGKEFKHANWPLYRPAKLLMRQFPPQERRRSDTELWQTYCRDNIVASHTACQESAWHPNAKRDSSHDVRFSFAAYLPPFRWLGKADAGRYKGAGSNIIAVVSEG